MSKKTFKMHIEYNVTSGCPWFLKTEITDNEARSGVIFQSIDNFFYSKEELILNISKLLDTADKE